ncbi:MAG TPA: zinc ribbon domain-containing protein [Anaerolineales bacterium]|jgi:NADH pyrophosphatase NudC (nudix superfamily)|nr:zinc ribbon domain-containing protein [Anaerolineales bacterium]
MDLGAILLLIALLSGVGFYLAAPLLNQRVRRSTEETQETSSLMAERERVINALQELDFDFKLGKIPEEDYPTQRAELLQKGAEVLKKLDTIALISAPSQALEQRDDRNQALSLSDDEIESMLAARRKARKTTSVGFCPKCGKPVLATDHFCPNCGKALK